VPLWGTRHATGNFAIRNQKALMSRILLVEDDQNVRVLLEHVLIDAGYEVDSTTTVTDAKSLLDSVTYDLLLADGRLPDGTGMALADIAQASGVKALIITGYAFQLADQQLGRYEFLMKPVRPAELVEAIDRALRSKK
jgi:two-component system response regulator HydG